MFVYSVSMQDIIHLCAVNSSMFQGIPFSTVSSKKENKKTLLKMNNVTAGHFHSGM